METVELSEDGTILHVGIPMLWPEPIGMDRDGVWSLRSFLVLIRCGVMLWAVSLPRFLIPRTSPA